MEKILTIGLIVILTSFKINAQMFYEEGFIITSNNEKRIGKIKQISNKEIIFIDSLNIKNHFYTNDLHSYSIDNFIFYPKQISINNEIKSVFIKEILQGYISLFEIPKPSDDVKYVLSNSENQYINLSKTNARSEFRKVMFQTTEPTIMRELNDGNFQFSPTFMTKILRKYNIYEKPEIQTIEPKRPLRINYGILIGYSINTLMYFDPSPTPNKYPSIYLTGNLSSQNDIPFGVFLSFLPHKPLSIEIEAYYHKNQGENTVRFQGVASEQVEKIYLKENGISTPLNLKLKIPVGKLDFYLKSGPKFVIIHKIEGKRTDLNLNRDYPIFSTDLSKKGVGYNIGLGFEKKVGKNFNPKIEYRYSSHAILSGANNIAKHKSHQIVLGFGFRNK